MKINILAFFFLVTYYANGQNNSTTVNGTSGNGNEIVGGTHNNVTIYNRDSTQNRQKPCDSKTTGNIKFKNNSDKVVYVYYNTPFDEYKTADPILIKPFGSEELYDLPVGVVQAYKVVTVKPQNRTSMHYIQAETIGRFSPDPCSEREVVINL